MTQARYTLELIRLASQPELQEQIRKEMMPWALDRFDWERFVSQWENWASLDIEEPSLAALYSNEDSACEVMA